MGAGRLFTFLLLGWALMFVKASHNRPDFAGRHYLAGQTLHATLLEAGQPKANSWKANAKIAILDQEGNAVPVTGKIIIYFQKGKADSIPAYGSVISFSRPLQEIRNSGNPGAFAYKTFSQRKDLYYQVYLRHGEWQQVQKQGGTGFKRLVLRLEAYCLEILKKQIRPESQIGVAQALIIGYQADLDKAILEQFNATGTTHIIAISGMHLGMIYMLLLFILRPLGKKRGGRLLRMFITLGVIWVFTFLTGAGPSITRASIMFSAIAFGQLWKRQGNTLNMLALAGLILLLLDPQNLFDAGFQLSFAAVMSIALFYRPIRKWFAPKNLLLRLTWDLVAVTLAAQILTTPIAIYLFHQFPTYFLLSNLIAVPLSTLCVYLLLALLMAGKIGFLAAPLGVVTGFLLEAFTKYVQWVATLPQSTIGHIQISFFQVILLMAAVSCLGFWLLRRQPFAVLPALACLLIFGGIRLYSQWQSNHQQQLIVYNVPGSRPAIDRVMGRQAQFLGDPEFQQQSYLRNFHLQGTRILFQYYPVDVQPLSENQNLYWATNGVNIFLAQTTLGRGDTAQHSDILIVGRNNRNHPEMLISQATPGQIVLLNGARQRQIEEWRVAADRLNLRLHCIGEDGAFVLRQPMPKRLKK